MRKGAAIFTCVFFLAVYADSQTESYFTSPRDAVQKITDLLQKADWPGLTQYYDLSTALQMDDGTAITRELLESGKYFYCATCPPSNSQVNSRYLNPFPLGLRYERNRASNEIGVIIVTVSREISSTDGNKQKISQDILLRKNDNGYRILPAEYAYYKPSK